MKDEKAKQIKIKDYEGKTGNKIHLTRIELLNQIETYKKDLAFQLTFEHIDYEYFIETAQAAKELNDFGEFMSEDYYYPDYEL